MIPIIYEASETAFISNGLGRLRDAIECRVTEERNGLYEMNMQYPVDGAHADLITAGRILAVTHDEGGGVEPFDIVSIQQDLDGVMDVHAVHVSYRQTGLTTYGENITTIADAFTMLEGAEPSNPFTYSTDVTGQGYMASADGTPRSVRQFLGGVEGSILDTYGGEYEFTGFSVILHRSRGVVRDFSIRYGVNLLDYDEDTDYQSTYTSCIPFWTGTDSDGNPVKIVGAKQTLAGASYNGRDICFPLDLTDKFEDAPTTGDLETYALAYMNSQQTNLPATTIKVDFARLQDLGVDDYGVLLDCNLCDTINVIYPYSQNSGAYKIVRTVWDVLADRYEEMELGTLSTTLAEALGVSNTLDRTSGGGGSPDILNAVYPVGSIYMSVANVDPGDFIGGTWEQIKDTFLLADGDTYTAGASGGSATHTLTEAELPSVSGTFNIRGTSTGGNLITSASGHFARSDTSNVTSVTNNSSSQSASTVRFSFGSGNAHNNMPPYLVVYVWKRIA